MGIIISGFSNIGKSSLKENEYLTGVILDIKDEWDGRRFMD